MEIKRYRAPINQIEIDFLIFILPIFIININFFINLKYFFNNY